MSRYLTVFDPTAPYRHEVLQKRHVLDGLRGKVVGFVDNCKPNFNFLVDDLAEVLANRHGVKSTVKHRKLTASSPASAEVMADLAKQCDLVITGSGD